jgi:hypothetical protein
MISNHSVSADIVLPDLMYQDLEEAIARLSKVCGFVEHYRCGAEDLDCHHWDIQHE